MEKENKCPLAPEWVYKVEGNQLVLFNDPKGWSNNGIRLEINKGKRTLHISGWYDSCVGIEGATISLDALTELFKPTKRK